MRDPRTELARVATVGPGDIVGEMGLLEMSVRSATVVADTPGRLLAMDPRRFHMLVERELLSRRVMCQLAARLRIADERHAAMLT